MHPPQTKPDPTRHVNLDDIRKQIDLIDHDLLELLSRRADLVHEVGLVKKRYDLQIYAPER